MGEMRNQFIYYMLGILASLFTYVFSFILLAKYTSYGIIIYIVFKENAGPAEYFTLSLIHGIPALITYWYVLKFTSLKISFGSALICYMIGHIVLLLIIPIIAKPEITPLVGFLIYFCFVLSGGFALTLRLHELEKSR